MAVCSWGYQVLQTNQIQPQARRLIQSPIHNFRLYLPALALLRIEADNGGFQLHYRPEGERQLAIHCWTTLERVKEEIEEVLELFDGDSSNTAVRIQEHMKNVRSVIGIELGFSQLEDMGVVFAYEVARWFGQDRGGLIKGDDDNWSMIDAGGFVHF